MKCVPKTLIILAVLALTAVITSAATLQAKVTDVPTGNILVVSNINRSVTVKLKSVAPPEVGQPFCEASRDHLKALILDKVVTVEYTHFVDGYLAARVFLNGIDVGSQMLRDGVAWYDSSTDYGLRDEDRDIYTQCEQAARAEKRGLWQDASPVAPWDFRKMQQVKTGDMLSGTSELRSNPRTGSS